MTGKPLVGSVVGPATLTHWGQVLQLPNAYGVVEVSFPDGGARAAGVHVLSELSRHLGEPTSGLHALTDVVNEVFEVGTETILICVPVGHVLYLVLRGSGDVYLKRGKTFARLLHGSGGISGEVRAGDTIILASAEFSRALTLEEAGGVFDHLTPEVVAERLTLLLHEKPYGEGSAAMVLQFGEMVEEEVLPERAASQEVTKLAQTKLFFAHFHPQRVKRHLSLSVLKNDIQRLCTHPKKLTFLLAVVLIAFFGVAVVLGIWKQSIQGASPAVISAVSDARHALDEGVALLPLNPVKGRQRLQAAQDIIGPLTKSVPARSQEGREIADLERQVHDNLTQSMQISSITPDLFFDAALVKKGGTISSIGFEGTTMGILDNATQTVISLDVTSKKSIVLGGGSTFAGMLYTTIHGNAMYVLTVAGVQQINLTDKTTQLVVKKDPQWGSIASLVSFGGNLYLLDTVKSRIWKYVSTDTGFSDLKEYLNPDTLPDLSQANSLAIDGSVWLGSTNGKLWKFTGGREDSFFPQGVDPAFGAHVILYTSDSTNNIYILDSDNKRVVVLAKDDTYLAQYVWKDSLVATQIAVSEELKKIFLLAEGKLYAINLK